MLKHLSMLSFFIVLTGLGLVGGWMAARQANPPPAGEEADAKDGEATPEHLDERTLANLGVEVKPATPGAFTRYRAVQAVIQDRPENGQPVVAPLGGIITSVHVETGGVAAAGTQLVTLVRDPIARPKPELTSDLLTPISEDVHTAVSKMRSAMGRMKIVDENLARIRKSRGGGGVPVLRASEIEFKNEHARLVVELDDARHELERHGLDDKEIAAVEGGASAPANVHLWEHALRRGGLWPAAADKLRAQLPAADRALPWCIVAIGELSASGLATNALADALAAEPELATHFSEVAGLLLEGMPLATVRVLATQGALAEEIVVRAPRAVARWDVTRVAVRPGQRVATGDVIATLHDARTMWMRLEPVGREIGLVVRALETGATLGATPLVQGAGPELRALRLLRIETHMQHDGHASHAYADVANELLGPSKAADAASRSWTLRAGTRYIVKVPVEEIPQCYVLPAAALATRGPDRVLYLRDGQSFKALVVRVLYEDDEVAVLPLGGGIFPGDPVAVSGAFALQLALQQDGGGADPHAGHGHAHN